MKKVILFVFFSLQSLYAAAESESRRGSTGVVCKAARETYGTINKNWRYVGSDGVLSTKSPHWKAAMENVRADGTKMVNLRLIGDPSNIITALESLVDSEAVLDCSAALTVVQIAGVRKLLGDEDFIKYAVKLHGICVERGKEELFFYSFPKQFQESYTGSYSAIGGFFGLYNVDEYHQFKPKGIAGAENLIQVGHKAYLGFGDLFKDGPVALDAVKESLRQAFIKTDDVTVDKVEHAKWSDFYKQNPDLYEVRRSKCQTLKSKAYICFASKKVKQFKTTGMW